MTFHYRFEEIRIFTLWISIQGISSRRNSQCRDEVRAKLVYSGKNKEAKVADVSKQVGKGQEERSYLDLLGLCSHWKDFGFYAE